MKLPSFSPLCGALLLGASTVLCWGTSAQAAEKIVLKYGPVAQSIQISDLEAFVTTGRKTPTLATILRLAKQDSDTIRGLMSLEIGVNVVALDRVLNSKDGEMALIELGKTVRTRSRAESHKALRAAVITSAADNKVSMLEILKNYPTSEIDVEVAAIGRTVDKLKGFAGNLQELLKNATASTSSSSMTTRTETRMETPPVRVQPASPPPASSDSSRTHACASSRATGHHSG